MPSPRRYSGGTLIKELILCPVMKTEVQEQGKIPGPGPSHSLPRMADIDSLLNGVNLSLDSTKRSTASYTVSAKESENVARRVFHYYDKRRTGHLDNQAIADMLRDLYKGIITDYVPSPAEIDGLRRVLDKNGDGHVTIDDVHSKVVKHLCVDNIHPVDGYYPYAQQTIKLDQNPLLFESNFGRASQVGPLTTLYDQVHTKGSLEDEAVFARKLFDKYDANKSKTLERNEILSIIIDTFKYLNRDTLPSKEDVDLYLGMMDGNGDRKISLSEFETFFLRAAKRRNIVVAKSD